MAQRWNELVTRLVVSGTDARLIIFSETKVWGFYWFQFIFKEDPLRKCRCRDSGNTLINILWIMDWKLFFFRWCFATKEKSGTVLKCKYRGICIQCIHIPQYLHCLQCILYTLYVARASSICIDSPQKGGTVLFQQC